MKCSIQHPLSVNSEVKIPVLPVLLRYGLTKEKESAETLGTSETEQSTSSSPTDDFESLAVADKENENEAEVETLTLSVEAKREMRRQRKSKLKSESPPDQVFRIPAEQLRQLPLYNNLIPLSRVSIVNTHKQMNHASTELTRAGRGEDGALGFDCEWRPIFVKDDVNTGPHLIQLSTMNHVYLFPIVKQKIFKKLQKILESSTIRKVGFDLVSDESLLRTNLGVILKGVENITLGYSKNAIGIVQAVAILFGQQFIKSRKCQRSNWSRLPLTAAQRSYAANDAYVALSVHRELRKRKNEMDQNKLPLVSTISGANDSIPSETTTIATDDKHQKENLLVDDTSHERKRKSKEKLAITTLPIVTLTSVEDLIKDMAMSDNVHLTRTANVINECTSID
jgi:ribonuclease D